MKTGHIQKIYRHVPLALAAVICLVVCMVLLPLFMADIYFQRGLAAFEARKSDQALHNLEGALFWDDDNFETYYTIGLVYQQLSQAEMDRFMQYNVTYKTVIAQPPVTVEGNPDGRVDDPKIKVKDLTSKDVKKRIRTAEPVRPGLARKTFRVIPSYPGSAEGYEKAAVQAYTKAARLNPRDARIYLGLAEMMQFAMKADETDRVFRKAVALDPNNANIHFAYGLFLLRKKQIELAVHEMRTCAAIYPSGAGKVFSTWIDNGGDIDSIKPIAGVSPTCLYYAGNFFKGRKYSKRAAEAYVEAFRCIGGYADVNKPQELKPEKLLPLLLEKADKLGLEKGVAYYRKLWEAQLSKYEKTEQ